MNALLFAFFLLVIALFSSLVYKYDKDFSFLKRDFTTSLRGIAMLLIMISHFTGDMEHGRLFTPVGGVGSNLFLLVSGYGMTESFRKYGLKDFWKKRFSKVWIPYAIATMILILFQQIQYSDTVKYLLCIKSFYWFIQYILCCYVLFWCVCKIAPKYRKQIILIVSLICLILLPTDHLAEKSLAFVSGLYISDYRIDISNKLTKKRNIIVLSIVLFVIGASFLALKQTGWYRDLQCQPLINIIQTMIKWPWALFVILAAKQIRAIPSNTLLFFTGTISYELYLVHFPFYSYSGTSLIKALLILIGAYLGAFIFSKINSKISSSINKMSIRPHR